MKVLSLGTKQINYLSRLYASIKEVNPEVEVSIINLKFFSEDVEKSLSRSFDHVLSLQENKTNVSVIFKAVKALISSSWHRRFFSSMLALSKNKREGLRLYSNLFKEDVFFNKHLGGFDIYHFHSLQRVNLKYLFSIPKSKKVILSFWGSDLMRTAGLVNYYIQSEALKRADVITTQSLELREIILAKFGREHFHKIRLLNFPMTLELFDLIDRLELPDASKILPNAKEKTIIIGHNGTPDNNHIDIIKSLNGKIDKNQYRLIIPFSYGGNKTYLQEIRNLLQTLEFKFTIIEQFLPIEELALLKLNAAYVIMMPVSDAQSAFFLESIYCGSVCIAGAWLPYGNFRRSNLPFIAVASFEDVADVIKNNERRQLIEKLRDTRVVIRDIFLSEQVPKAWGGLYQDSKNR